MKIKFGAIVVDGRGKVGGHVASKNRGGSYLRTKVTPVNPRTTAQNAVRSRLTEIAQSWKALTAAQRAGWNAAVQDFQRTNIFGDIKTPSGFNLYQRLNLNLGKIGVAFIDDAPLPSDVQALTSLSLSVDTGNDTVQLTFSPAIAAGQSFVVSATPPLSPGKSFVKSEFRDIAVLTNSDTSPASVFDAYFDKFGSAPAGTKVFVQLRGVNSVTGQAGQPIEASAIAL